MLIPKPDNLVAPTSGGHVVNKPGALKMKRNMKGIFFILLAAPFSLAAAPCTLLPKPAMTLDEVQIAITEEGGKITLAWPSIDPTVGCCSRSDFDPASWRQIFRSRGTAGSGSTSLTAFLTTISSVPGRALTPEEETRCQGMIDRVLSPATIVGQGQR